MTAFFKKFSNRTKLSNFLLRVCSRIFAQNFTTSLSHGCLKVIFEKGISRRIFRTVFKTNRYKEINCHFSPNFVLKFGIYCKNLAVTDLIWLFLVKLDLFWKIWQLFSSFVIFCQIYQNSTKSTKFGQKLSKFSKKMIKSDVKYFNY